MQLLEVFEPFTLKTGGFMRQFFGKLGGDTAPKWYDSVSHQLFLSGAIKDIPQIPKTYDQLPSLFI